MKKSAAVLTHFKRVDPTLYRAAKMMSQADLETIEEGVTKRKLPGTLFGDLCSSIIGQQLSGKAADTIYNRFEVLLEKKVTPEAILRRTHEEIRSVGISNAKIRALHDLAIRVDEGLLPLKKLSSMSDQEVRSTLIAVKGIGPWTADMILMFSLNREDVFSYGDLGLQNACMSLYRLRQRPSKERLESLSRPWSPYRTWAARILWKYYDQSKAQKKTSQV